MKDRGSFRDPSGFIFQKDQIIYRQINRRYQKQYETLMGSGLYNRLIKEGFLISHEEIASEDLEEGAYKIIQPQKIPFISYPYEWSFGEYKDAALVTLKIQRIALEYNMTLKDASAYNIQFQDANAKLIDTLSFDDYQEGTPWVAYQQFCKHFLAPLLLMAEVDIRLSQLMRVYIDGIPLDLASKLLHGKGGFTALQHITWHAKASEKHADDGKQNKPIREATVRKSALIALIEGLIRSTEKINLKKIQTEWGDYYSETNYSEKAIRIKGQIITDYLHKIQPKTVWDLGANDGRYSKIAVQAGAEVVAFDIDPIAVERNYQDCKKGQKHILPLVMDLTNPSPAIGFANQERGTITDRQIPDCIMALALIHHLAISNNLPFEMISGWLAECCTYLIIEFVPKQDSQVQTLLKTREDIFTDYSESGFEASFEKDFQITEKQPVEDSDRILYLLRTRK